MQIILKTNNSEAIADTLGGELISYKNNGKEYVWCGDAAYWTGHAPLLFPFVSALKNDTVRIGGSERHFTGKHGFARKSQFELVESTDTKAVFMLKQNELTLQFFPFNFELYEIHEISDNGFSTTYKVVNTDEKEMVFCIGGHPGFQLEGSLEDYDLVFEKDENCPLLLTDEKSLFDESYDAGIKLTGKVYSPKYSDFDRDALIAKDIKSRRVNLVRKDNGKGVEFDFTGFPLLVLWTPPKKNSPFICLEPWYGLPAMVNETGDFEDKPYAIKLASGKSFETVYKVRII